MPKIFLDMIVQFYHSMNIENTKRRLLFVCCGRRRRRGGVDYFLPLPVPTTANQIIVR
jgi:hypothetical protein